jgi:predicted lipid-binding transport protein (Tim44 family)
MKRVLIAVFAAVVGLAMGVGAGDAEAKRLGGGKSSGIQRDSTMKRDAAPTQNAVPAKPAQAAAAPQPSGMSRWLGPLAGLAAGIGLAALFSHLGMGEGFSSVVMMLLLAAAAFFVIRLLFRRREPQAAPLQYAGAGAAPARFDAPAAVGGATSGTAPLVPAGFDAEGFLRQAKLNFVRLQAANDARNIEDVRNFTTPEMFAEIRLEMQERGEAPQQTDVVVLNADLLEVAQEGSQHIASVRFHGSIRETAGGAPEAFDEVWHLAKPIDGGRGWVIAGIQQYS